MAKTRIINYKIGHTSLIKKLKLVTFSDSHSNHLILNDCIRVIKKEKPDFVCVPGDILDQSDDNIEKIIKKFKTMSEYAPIITSLGNHDIETKENGEWLNKFNSDLKTEFESISGGGLIT